MKKEEPGIVCTITKLTEITGNIITENDIRIDGQIKGNIVSHSRVVVGKAGNIEGNIECANCDIWGVVKGNVTVKEVLTLKETANLVGDMKTNKLVIEQNATFLGNCTMTQENIGNGETKE